MVAHHRRLGLAVCGKKPHPISLRSSPRTTLCKTAASPVVKISFNIPDDFSNIRMVLLFSQRSLEIISKKVKKTASPVVKIIIDHSDQKEHGRNTRDMPRCRGIIKDCWLSIFDYKWVVGHHTQFFFMPPGFTWRLPRCRNLMLSHFLMERLLNSLLGEGWRRLNGGGVRISEVKYFWKVCFLGHIVATRSLWVAGSRWLKRRRQGSVYKSGC